MVLPHSSHSLFTPVVWKNCFRIFVLLYFIYLFTFHFFIYHLGARIPVPDNWVFLRSSLCTVWQNIPMSNYFSEFALFCFALYNFHNSTLLLYVPQILCVKLNILKKYLWIILIQWSKFLFLIFPFWSTNWIFLTMYFNLRVRISYTIFILYFKGWQPDTFCP